MKITVELSHDELCDVVRDHVLKRRLAGMVDGDAGVEIGGRYSYSHPGATVIIDTDAPGPEIASALQATE